MKFNLVFKKGLCTVARVEGTKTVSKHDLTLAEWEQVLATEALVEKLTGVRLHIEEVK